MLRGSSGFYSYAIYEHLKDWPDFDLGETRITFKLRKDKYTFMLHLLCFWYKIAHHLYGSSNFKELKVSTAIRKCWLCCLQRNF